jgi:hypothetical protein
MRDLTKNLSWGLTWGLGFAAWFSLIAGLIYLIAPREHAGGPPVQLPHILTAYWAGGLVAGVLVGVLRPVTRYWWGAALVGLLAMIPISASIGLAMWGWFTDWTTINLQALLVYGSVVGPVGGILLWRRRVAAQGPNIKPRSQ